MAEIMSDNTVIGNLNILNSAKLTKAVVASRTLFSSSRTNEANDTIDTISHTIDTISPTHSYNAKNNILESQPQP